MRPPPEGLRRSGWENRVREGRWGLSAGPVVGPAALAPGDHLATRVLLQALVPGLVRLSHTAGHGDPNALDDMITLAWERIATYPTTRHGHVAANVLRDVRKRYRQLQQLDRPRKRHQGDSELDSDIAIAERRAAAPPAEDVALERAFLNELRAAVRRGVISEPALRVVIQTRILGESVSELATRCGINRNTLASWRFRAERRLRELEAAWPAHPSAGTGPAPLAAGSRQRRASPQSP